MEPIAVIGLACRFPGNATNIENLWKCLLDGQSVATQIPKERLNVDGHYHPDPNRGGSFYTKTGHFLAESTATFDAPFFSISKSEAMAMDPQQRLMLENVYHAFENAGLPMISVASSQTSVFVGGGITQDYLYMLNHDPELMLKFKATGTSGAIVSNRVSWFYDLKGTSFSIDTACSSSMVALHQACQNLRSGDSEMAVVSGVGVIEYPGSMVVLGALGMLSPDGKCYSFDHRANGYGRGEGVGTVIIKPLSAAMRDGNTIRAVIRATGSSQDGRTPGITMPSQEAQQRLIHKVYTEAGLDRSTTRYVEAHGTGTFAGDPIEAGAIAAAFETSKNKDPLYIGSIKANIGHLEAGAGIAGLIKAILIVENGIIPPSANFETINPKIPLEDWNIRIAKTQVLWPQGDVRRTSVNSFGFGGTNAHAIVDDTWSVLRERDLNSLHADSVLTYRKTVNPAANGSTVANGRDNQSIMRYISKVEGFVLPTTKTSPSNGISGLVNSNATHNTNLVNGCGKVNEVRETNGISEVNESLLDTKKANVFFQQPRVFVLSAFDETGIKRSANSLSEHLNSFLASDLKLERKSERTYMEDLAYTLVSKRTMFPWKAFCIAASWAALAENLEKQVSKPIRSTNNVPQIGFIFTGQGAQWSGMGKTLSSYLVFSKSISEATEYMKSLGSPWNLGDELQNISSDIQDSFLSQAACTAVQVATIDLLVSWNVKPVRVVGHSSGEIAAAYCAGQISRTDAWKVAYFRGYVSSTLTKRNGAMLAVGISEDDIESYLQEIQTQGGRSKKLAVACINSPRNITISGDESEIDILQSVLAKDDVFARKLAVRNAYHSYHMEDVAGSYLSLIGDLSSENVLDMGRKVEMFSSVTGKSLCNGEARSGAYWVKNLISSVRFSDALLAMSGTDRAVEKSKLRLAFKGANLPIHHVVEIGPHSALRSAVRETLSPMKDLSLIEYHHVLSRNEPSPINLLNTVASLFCHGYPVAMDAINHINKGENVRLPRLLTDLPPYEFNHSRKYWVESRLSKNYRQRESPRHDLCGAQVADWNPDEPRWRGFLRLSELPWLKDHEITGNIIFPGVGYSIMVLEAIKQIAIPDQILNAVRLQDVTYKAALMIPDTPEGVEYMLSMKIMTETSADASVYWREFRISSCGPDDQEWTEHCAGLVRAEYNALTGEVDNGREVTAEMQADRETMEMAESLCTDTLSTAMTYDGWDQIGISWGPLFRNISEMRLGDKSGKSLCTVTIPDVASSMPSGFLQPHTIQPATMDSLLGTFMTAVMDGSRDAKIRSPQLPTFIKEVWVSMSIPNEPGHRFTCYTQAKPLSFTQNEADIMVWDPSTGRTVMRLSGVKTKPLQTTNSIAEDSMSHPCYFIEWQPHIDILRKGSLVFQNMLTHLPDSVVQEQYLRRTQLSSMIYILDALAVAEMLDATKMLSHHQRYLEWMRYRRNQLIDGLIPSFDSSNTSQLLEESERRRILAEIPVHTARERLLHRVGPKIGQVLAGESDPLEIMFRQDDLMDHFYAEASAPGSTKILLNNFLEALGHNLTNLKVIEIGAGTGSTTLPTLEALSPRFQSHSSETSISRISLYTYTDISAGFFEHAKTKFNQWENIMEYKVLDIESSPAKQGFEEGFYDVVIASNVLHATADISKTLRNVRSLLRQGGKLILVEGVQENFLLGPTCFGLLPGWWLSSEPIRKWGPLMSEMNWDTMLSENGFSGTDITLNDFDNPELHELCIFVSTTLPDTPVCDIEYSFPVYVVCLDPQGAGDELTLTTKNKLSASGYPNCSVIDYNHALRLNLNEALCIVLNCQRLVDLTSLSETEFKNIQHILISTSMLLWISGDELQNPLLATATGLIRTARWERDYDKINFALLTIENPIPDATEISEKIVTICHKLPSNSPTYERNAEYWLRDGNFWTARLRESAKTSRHMDIISNDLKPSLQPYGANATRALKLTTSQPGMLSKLLFTSDPVWPSPLAPGDVEIKIEAVSLNFRDVMIAMGQLPNTILGYEGMGTVTRVGSDVQRVVLGDRVVTYGASKTSGTLQTYYRVTQEAVLKLPANIDIKDAVAMITVFMTVLYSLRVVARIAAKETILIHSAAGGTGQAAIQIAQLTGAEVFVTVSTIAKRDFLIREYNICEDHVFSSRDLSFVKGIQRMTAGRGVDIILNSLSGEALRRSWDCIAPFGRFIELGKRDIVANGRLQMSPFSNNVMYYGMDMKTIMEQAPKTATALLEEAYDLFSEGKIHSPFPISVYSYAELETAFRQLQSGKQMGKIVMIPKESDLVQVLPELPLPLKFSGSASYVLSGGLGGIGRSIARWMAARGARNFIFLSRSGAKTEEAQALIEHLKKNSCHAESFICDIADKAQLSAIIEECEKSWPPIKGCVHGSMVLEDAMLINMTHENWVAATRPKVQGTINLHEVLNKDMDFFVALSSVTSIVGNRGQANYAAGNAFQDAFARHLVCKGLRKAVSINLGSIESVGYVAEKLDRARAMVLQWGAISESRMHDILEYHIDPRIDFNASGRYQSVTGMMTASTIAAKGLPLPECLNYPLFTQLHVQENSKSAAGATDMDGVQDFPIQHLLRSCDSFESAVNSVQEAVQRKISSLMAIPWGEIEASKPLQTYGVDSLVAVELRTWVLNVLGAEVAVLDMLGRNTISEFSRKVARLSSLLPVAFAKQVSDEQG